MQKKPGQISANTLSLRFMQNAAKAKHEKELEAVRPQIKSQEEWEMPASLKQSLGISALTDQGNVTYEDSYIPFLFPKRLRQQHGEAECSSGGTRKHWDDESEGDNEIVIPSVAMKGRRSFGPGGNEEVKGFPQVDKSQHPPLINGAVLPRGARSISSHGRAAAKSSSNASFPAESTLKPHDAQHAQKQALSLEMTTSQSSQQFMKPPIDYPRTESGERNKRPPVDAFSETVKPRKSKKRREQ